MRVSVYLHDLCLRPGSAGVIWVEGVYGYLDEWH